MSFDVWVWVRFLAQDVFSGLLANIEFAGITRKFYLLEFEFNKSVQ